LSVYCLAPIVTSLARVTGPGLKVPQVLQRYQCSGKSLSSVIHFYLQTIMGGLFVKSELNRLGEKIARSKITFKQEMTIKVTSAKTRLVSLENLV